LWCSVSWFLRFQRFLQIQTCPTFPTIRSN
jgi:hypothetical protein